MAHSSMDRVTFSVAAQTVLRILIASYFLAVALRLIPGTDLGILFRSVLPDTYASATAAGLVFILSFMIMIGMATRMAALTLALMTFFASYLVMIELGVHGELGAFWRDLALIAALLLTYGDQAVARHRRRRLIRRQIVPRRVSSIMDRALAEEEAIAAMRPMRVARGAGARLAQAETPDLPAEASETAMAEAETTTLERRLRPATDAKITELQRRIAAEGTRPVPATTAVFVSRRGKTDISGQPELRDNIFLDEDVAVA